MFRRLFLRPFLVLMGPVMLGILGVASAAASGGGDTSCIGSLATGPGIVAPGNYSSLTVFGFCVIPGGDVTVSHNLVVAPGGALLANFPSMGPGQPEGDATVVVGGNVVVESGAALALGCAPSFGCATTTSDVVMGNLIADQALGVLAHADTIKGNVTQSGGGGGVTCTPSGLFGAFGLPVFSAYEDGTIGGNLTISEDQSCWLGVARESIGGNTVIADNNLADPDAIEILSSTISGNLICEQNSMVWDSVDLSPVGALFPRGPEPNTVNGRRVGQGVLSSPTSAGGTSGPGPF